MILLSALVLWLVSIANTNGYIRRYEWNKYCGRVPCPRYKLIEKKNDFEIRQYPFYKWAAAHSEGYSLYWATYYNKLKLANYRTGRNEERITMPRTLPLITRIIDTDSTLEKDFTTFYWIPNEYQENHPNPLVKEGEVEVDVIVWEERTVYTRPFRGYPSQYNIRYHIRMLRQSLKNAGIKVDEFYVYFVTYTAYRRCFFCRHEVMFIK